MKQVLELWGRAGAEPSVTDDPGALRRRLRRDRNLFVLAWNRGRLVDGIVVKRNRAASVFWSELGYRRHVEVARHVKDLRP